MCLLPCHFLVLSHSFTLMPSCEFHTSLILATLPSWHVAPTQAPHPASITGFLHFCCRCFATSDLSKGFICRWWWKVQQGFFDFSASRCQLKECDKMHLTPPDVVLVWLPTVHSAVLLSYLDRFTRGTYTIYLLQQEGIAIYHNMIIHLTCTVISEMDGSRCCGGSASVTLHMLPEPQTKLPNHSCSAVTHWHSVPQGAVHLQLKCIASWRCYY